MSKKIDDDFEDDFDDDFDDIPPFIEGDEPIEEDEIEININYDDDDLDIIIEIDENELDTLKSKDDVSDDEDVILSKHKIEGKHSLKHDSIFKGKKDDEITDNDIDITSIYFNSTIEVDKSSVQYGESIENESYIRGKLIKERVYQVLSENTNINFLNNRRKPSRVDFNNYYNILLINLKDDSFSNVELFNELAFYFSDNLFNMFKLLDNKWRLLIISELQEHIGKNINSKEIRNRNIYEGTEIEFYWLDEFKKKKIITGVVVETYYEENEFKVDSYENIYIVKIEDIIKILNNTKFKYNLNKLNNIDFL